MRGAFVNTLVELAEHDPRILLLTGDLGFMVLEPFAVRFPERFFNVGVAEQNLVGMATGLAEAGYIPFVYSIVTFAVLRPYEFIRNGPIFHQFPMRIVGVGGGLDYGSNGLSHHGLEDIGVLRIQPGITVVAPADSVQARVAIAATWDLPGPVYYRLSKDSKTPIAGLGRFQLGRVQTIGDGNDLLLITVGNVTSEVITAMDVLAGQGISCTVAVVSSFNPDPVEDLAELLSRFPIALTVEAHFVVGGLGSLVSEIVAERKLGCRVVRCGVKKTLGAVSGSQDYLYREYGLSSDKLVETARGVLR